METNHSHRTPAKTRNKAIHFQTSTVQQITKLPYCVKKRKQSEKLKEIVSEERFYAPHTFRLYNKY